MFEISASIRIFLVSSLPFPPQCWPRVFPFLTYPLDLWYTELTPSSRFDSIRSLPPACVAIALASGSRTISMHICKMQNCIVPRSVFFLMSSSPRASAFLVFQFTLHQRPPLTEPKCSRDLPEGAKEGGAVSAAWLGRRQRFRHRVPYVT